MPKADIPAPDGTERARRPETPALHGSTLFEGDALTVLRRLPAGFARCVVTSPPYWGLRDYGIAEQIGLESTMTRFLRRLVSVFAEARRVLAGDGTLWLNIGDGYTSGNRGYRAPDRKNPARAMGVRPDTPEGFKPKDLLGIPWRLAFALQADGWYLRSDVVWYKPNAMPESVKDRPARSHEFLFMFTKSEKYYYDWRAAREPADGGGMRNLRSVWQVNTRPFAGAHFAVFPQELVRPCILASTEPGDYVLDPFFGSGTVGVVCRDENRLYVGIELNPEYVALAAERLEVGDSSVIRIGAARCSRPGTALLRPSR
ncbi:MAG: site-specific DNA-methyltransferase [Deltaproteobacteria bacterium]|jgi:site-specific DNA-methyltransferase (adenine-specific)|nr:site-specific DNA-methyltransferase [Deltaproteobacteria bacterium]